MKIAIGADHAGFDMKEQLLKMLKDDAVEVVDCGTFDNQSCNYPTYAHAVAKVVLENKLNKGILICGTGNGMNMTANKHTGIRAALCWTEEIARLSRQHNDANILSIPARFVDVHLAADMMFTFLKVEFEGGRHATRLGLIEM